MWYDEMEEKSQLFHLLLAYADVFADAEDGLGRTRVVKHSIVTGDNPPIKQSCRRAPPSKREHVRHLIHNMLKMLFNRHQAPGRQR